LAEGDFTTEQPIRFEVTVSVWDLKKRERLWTQEWGAELPRHISFAGDQLVVAGERFAVWDGASGRLVMDISSQEGDEALFYVTGVRSPEGRWLLAGRSDGVAELIDPKSGKLVRKLTAHGVPVESCHFTPNSRQVIVTYQDRTALLWELPAEAAATVGPALFSTQSPQMAGIAGPTRCASLRPQPPRRAQEIWNASLGFM
jgi:WD40 repeat protein